MDRLSEERKRRGIDIDILVEFESRKSLLDLAGLKIELEEKLKRDVDVLTYKSLHPSQGKNSEEEGRYSMKKM